MQEKNSQKDTQKLTMQTHVYFFKRSYLEKGTLSLFSLPSFVLERVANLILKYFIIIQ